MKLIEKLKLRSPRPSIKNGFKSANANLYDAGFYKIRGLPLFNYSGEDWIQDALDLINKNIKQNNE